MFRDDPITYLTSFDSPQSLWHALVGDIPAPGSFPMTEEDAVVPERYQMAAWEESELRRIMERKRR